jgi:hypothetical protein
VNQQEVVKTLRDNAAVSGPVELVKLVSRLHGPLVGFEFVLVFKQAFPEIPLGAIQWAAQWREVGGADDSEENFEATLKPWLPRVEGRPPPQWVPKWSR